jgi:hypothetical protein
MSNEHAPPEQTNHTVAGLVKLRAERAGLIKAAQEQLETAITELATIDATLKIVAPDIKLEAIKPKRPHQPRQRISDLLLTALRKNAPLTGRDAAIQVIAARGQSINDTKVVNATVQKVQTTLQHLRRKKVVTTIPGSRPLAWTIA